MKPVGKAPSDRDKFTRVVIGTTKTSIQDFSKDVGIESREQVVLEEVRMMCLTSAAVVEINCKRAGGGIGGGR